MPMEALNPHLINIVEDNFVFLPEKCLILLIFTLFSCSIEALSWETLNVQINSKKQTKKKNMDIKFILDQTNLCWDNTTQS